jgi:hypothetical protein
MLAIGVVVVLTTILLLAVSVLSNLGADIWLWTVLVPIGLYIYFLPTFVARGNNHRNLLAVLLFNIFLGWTLLGWVVALVWASMKSKHQPDQSS